MSQKERPGSRREWTHWERGDWAAFNRSLGRWIPESLKESWQCVKPYRLKTTISRVQKNQRNDFQKAGDTLCLSLNTSGALQCCAITAGVATTDIILQSGALKDAQELPPNDSANLFILQCMTWGSLTLWCQETFQKRDTSSKHLGQSFYSFRIFKTKYAELKTSTIDSTRAAFLSCSRYGSRSGACSDQGGVCGYTWNLSYLHTFNWNLVERRPRGV